MTLIDRHVFKALLRGGAPVLLLLLGLFGFLQLAEQLEDVGQGAFSSLDAMRVTVFSLPRILIDLLPVTCLLGSIIGFGALARDEELVILRTSGISALRLLRPLFVLVIALIVSVFATQAVVIPSLEAEAARLQAKRHQTDEPSSSAALNADAQEYWTRDGSRIVRVGRADGQDGLAEIEIYDLDAQDHVLRIVRAASGEVVGSGEWLLNDAHVTALGDDGVNDRDHVLFALTAPLAGNTLNALLHADFALPPLQLREHILRLQRNGLDAHRYEVLYWQMLSLPVGLLAMSLLGLPFVSGSTRSITMGARVAGGVMVGLLFYLLERLSTQLALLYQWPAPLTGFAPDLLALLLAMLLISRMR